jgi:hypothetical protein
MSIISTNTTITVPAGALLLFKAGGIARAIDDAGNVYQIGLNDMIMGPYVKSQTVEVLVTSGSIEYVVDTDGDASDVVKFDRYSNTITDPASLDAVRGAADMPTRRNRTSVRFVGGAGQQAVTAASGGQVNINDTQIALPANCVGVRFILANFDTTATLTVNAARYSTATTHMSNTGVSWKSGVTFGGASTVTMAQAYTAAANGGSSQTGIVPGLAVTDLIPAVSVARADGSAPPFMRFRADIGAGAAQLLGPGSMVGLNGVSWGNGFKVASFTFKDLAANIASSGLTVADYGEGLLVVGAIIYTDSQFLDIGCFGDSHYQTNWPSQLTGTALARGVRISAQNWGASGRPYDYIMGTLDRVLDSPYRPQIAAFPAWTINEASSATQASLDYCWARCLAAIEKCQRLGVTPAVSTLWPQSGYSWTAIQSQNARVMALPNSVIKLDFASVVTTGSVINPAYDSGDGTHLSTTAGNAALVDYVLSRLSSVVA